MICLDRPFETLERFGSIHKRDVGSVEYKTKNFIDFLFERPRLISEQHDYEKSKFEDDCFKINAIPLRIDQQEGH